MRAPKLSSRVVPVVLCWSPTMRRQETPNGPTFCFLTRAGMFATSFTNAFADLDLPLSSGAISGRFRTGCAARVLVGSVLVACRCLAVVRVLGPAGSGPPFVWALRRNTRPDQARSSRSGAADNPGIDSAAATAWTAPSAGQIKRNNRAAAHQAAQAAAAELASAGSQSDGASPPTTPNGAPPVTIVARAPPRAAAAPSTATDIVIIAS